MTVADLLHRFCIGRPCRVIESGGAPYLVRVYLGHWRGYRLYLHHFLTSDGERWTHNHPFDGLSLVLSGAYLEEVLPWLGARLRTRRVRFFNWIPRRRLHRISRVAPHTWTLFLHGPHRQQWGFLDPVETEDDSAAVLYHNPFDQADSAGAHWWAKPGVAVYPAAGVVA